MPTQEILAAQRWDCYLPYGNEIRAVITKIAAKAAGLFDRKQSLFVKTFSRGLPWQKTRP